MGKYTGALKNANVIETAKSCVEYGIGPSNSSPAPPFDLRQGHTLKKKVFMGYGDSSTGSTKKRLKTGPWDD
jgi:hypothetical protein